LAAAISGWVAEETLGGGDALPLPLEAIVVDRAAELDPKMRQ
jgi:hypothetical protein